MGLGCSGATTSKATGRSAPASRANCGAGTSDILRRKSERKPNAPHLRHHSTQKHPSSAYAPRFPLCRVWLPDAASSCILRAMLPRARRPPPAPRISRGSVARPSMRRSFTTAPPENSAPPPIACAPCAARAPPSQCRSHDHRGPARWSARPRSEPRAGRAVLHDGAWRPGCRGHQGGEARHWWCVPLALCVVAGGHRRLRACCAGSRPQRATHSLADCARIPFARYTSRIQPCEWVLSLRRSTSPTCAADLAQTTRGAGARHSSARKVHTSFQ